MAGVNEPCPMFFFVLQLKKVTETTGYIMDEAETFSSSSSGIFQLVEADLDKSIARALLSSHSFLICA